MDHMLHKYGKPYYGSLFDNIQFDDLSTVDFRYLEVEGTL